MSTSLEISQNQLSDTPTIISAMHFAGYLVIVDSINQGEGEYEVPALVGQLNTVMHRSLDELELGTQKRVGPTRFRKIQTYLTDLVDPFGRDFAIVNLGLESSRIDQIKNPFIDQAIVRAIWAYHHDRRHMVDPAMLEPYVTAAPTSTS